MNTNPTLQDRAVKAAAPNPMAPNTSKSVPAVRPGARAFVLRGGTAGGGAGGVCGA